MGYDLGGLISIIVFYILILAVGLWAARKTGLRTKNVSTDDVMLANRSIGVVVGTFTMTATWVGGGYINGTTEIVSSGGGLVWCQAPIGYAVSLVIGGFIFRHQDVRTCGYTTMLDPFLFKYGDLMNHLLYIPALTGDVFWSAAILTALGASLSVILSLDITLSIIVSATIACIYTLIGGLYAVAYTDVVQLICMFIGLWLCVPFTLTDESLGPLSNSSQVWMGELQVDSVPLYADTALLLIFGGIPWQVYWQRVLAAKSANVARLLSFLGAIGCVVMALPSILIGVAAASANWNETEYGQITISVTDRPLTLPLAMRYLCPPVVSYIGLGAISAAVMSSMDSSVLSSSSMFSRNIVGVMYSRIYKVKMSNRAHIWTMRVAQLVITALACYMAISVESIYGLWVLCSDFVYVLLFPQLLCVLYFDGSNTYGSLASFITGLSLRLLGGDNVLNIPAVIQYPYYDAGSNTQMFPFRTLSMVASLVTLFMVSYLAKLVFSLGYLPDYLDVFGCFKGQGDSFHQEMMRYDSKVDHSNASSSSDKRPKIDKWSDTTAPRRATNCAASTPDHSQGDHNNEDQTKFVFILTDIQRPNDHLESSRL
ncbi:hypothetical protein Btru_025196 [Bulinus truncatus]|nr:hypothetical protein Btru_025196 [Bulinus truncatus]